MNFKQSPSISITRDNNQRGFSLFELIIVIIVFGIIGSIAGYKLNNIYSVSTALQAEKFSQNLRHSQLLALNWGCELDVIITTNNYSINNRTAYVGKFCDTAGIPIQDPSTGNAFDITLEDNTNFTAPNSFFFDSLGRPNNGIGLIASTITLTLTGNNSNWEIIIEPITGFITLNKI